MKEPKTINGYIALLERVAWISGFRLKGYEKLTPVQQIKLSCISTEIYNALGEYENEHKHKP